MKLVDIKFRNHTIALNCEDEGKLKSLSERLNQRLEGATAFKNASDIKFLYINALMMEEEILSLKAELEEYKSKYQAELDNSNQVLSDTLNYVAEYIENIAKRLES